MAHGTSGTGNCTQPFESKLQHEAKRQVTPRGKRHLHALEIRGRVDGFVANEWRVLDKAARLAGTPPTKQKPTPPPATTTPGLSQRAVDKNKRELREKMIKRAVKIVDVGDLDRGARILGSPQYVITRRILR